MTTPSVPSLTLSNGTGQNSFDRRPTSQSFPYKLHFASSPGTTLRVLIRIQRLVGEVLCHNFQDGGNVEAVVNSLMVVGNLGFGIEDVVQYIESSLDNAIQGNTIDHRLHLPTHRLIRIPPLTLAD